jgi:ferritin-like metal-binding protein YciE
VKLADLAQQARSRDLVPGDQAPEHCDLCAEPIAPTHRHLLDLESRRLLCACRACTILFDPAGDPQLESLYNGHIIETREHLRLLEERLEANDGSRSMAKDLAGRMTAAQLGVGVVADSDTPAKLVAVAYGFEHYEIAMYELIKRLAKLANDKDTAEMADKILVNERQATEKLEASYDLALERALYGALKA